MNRYRRFSVLLLCISAIIGLVRGYRMTLYPSVKAILFPYPEDIIKDTLFSNYSLFGWIIFYLLGVFSVIVIIAIFSKIRMYAYLIIVEGIFVSFFTSIHILYTGFGLIHLLILPLSLSLIVLGVLQTPKEF